MFLTEVRLFFFVKKNHGKSNIVSFRVTSSVTSSQAFARALSPEKASEVDCDALVSVSVNLILFGLSFARGLGGKLYLEVVTFSGFLEYPLPT